MNRPLPATNNNHDHAQQNTFKVSIIFLTQERLTITNVVVFFFFLGYATWRQWCWQNMFISTF
jgi:hypothetical protein